MENIGRVSSTDPQEARMLFHPNSKGFIKL
jgi:hypothetical protein